MTTNNNQPNAAEAAELPAEVREAICAVINTHESANGGELGLSFVDDLCATIAPLWPKPAPAPVPSDAEVAAAVERLSGHSHSKHELCNGVLVADLRTVLAALAEAQSALRFASSLLEEYGTPGAEMFRKECRAAIDDARAKEDRSHE